MSVTTAESIKESIISHFVSKIESRSARVGIVGMGYVGLPLALLYSGERFRVTGFDIDRVKVDTLNTSGSYIVRILPDEIGSARQNGFLATSDFERISEMDAIIICVPTPLGEHMEPDMTYIVNTATSIGPHIREGQLIILESTTYPGTTEDVLIPILEKTNVHGLRVATPAGAERNMFYVAFSPEREDPGRTDIARHDVPKVVGGVEPLACEMASALYGAIFGKVVRVSTPAVAEMTKLLENIYRCVNIALVNDLKLLCMRMGIDIWEVIEAARTKPYGFQAFYPGPGLGGHCIPIDPFYLSWKAREFDCRTRFIELAGEINSAMPQHVVNSIAGALNVKGKSLHGAKLLVLGIAYKKDIDDLRESPALTVIELLQKQGATVSYNDPYCPFVGRGRKYDLQMRSVPLENLGEYDCVVIVTDHSVYDYPQIVAESRLIVDTRNATAGCRASHVIRC